MLKILIQGELGSFHHQAAEQLFGRDIEIIPCSTFSQLFARLDDKTIGLSAIENSLHGSINEVYDLLEKSGAQIFAETELSIHQNLIGLPNSDAKEIREIYSHPVALDQCKDYLEKNFPRADKIEFEDTAAAVRHIAAEKDPTKAAIAGVQTLNLFDVKVLAENIEDNPVNFTRFVALTKNKSLIPHPDLTQTGKSSLILTTGHQPGALYEALGIFVAHQLNLTKLQSRPIIGEKWRYKFYIDFLGNDKEAKNVVKDLQEAGNEVHLLGSF
ncbi:prephenate dehydratase [Candidatus Saccharibacteria bacterium]|nr:prephenate dehydratase [Candidatus Saccharibacteria bacterium]